MAALLTQRPWVIVLAGGEGSRLRALTRDTSGRVVPKQFWRLRDHPSLLGRALDRALALTDAGRVVSVVMEHHRPWWSAQLSALPAQNLVRQREPRGTAVAIFFALMEIVRRDPAATVVVLPSDHGVDDEGALAGTIGRALEETLRWPEHLILLGMEAEEPDPSFGWVVPAPGRSGHSHAVESFVEKPDREEAGRILRHGGLVNCFIVAANGASLLKLYRLCLPELVLALEAPGTLPIDPLLVVPARDFAHDLLERAVRWLRVIRTPVCGWTDLGTPDRLRRWLERSGEGVVWGEGGVPATVPLERIHA